MKKIIVICACVGSLFWVWVALKLTHTLEYYKAATPSNMPTFHAGDIFFASWLKTPARNCFISFKLPDKKYPSIFRCVAKSGDIFEIKNAQVFLNGKLLNEPYTWNQYDITNKELVSISGYVEQYKYPIDTINDSVHLITFSANELKAYHLKLKLHSAVKGQANPDLFPAFAKLGYNEDNFGPVTVPKNSYFVLGDNRHDAFDSRYIGFIKKDEVIATVLNH